MIPAFAVKGLEEVMDLSAALPLVGFIDYRQYFHAFIMQTLFHSLRNRRGLAGVFS
jgi:hypothetical protein